MAQNDEESRKKEQSWELENKQFDNAVKDAVLPNTGEKKLDEYKSILIALAKANDRDGILSAAMTDVGLSNASASRLKTQLLKQFGHIGGDSNSDDSNKKFDTAKTQAKLGNLTKNVSSQLDAYKLNFIDMALEDDGQGILGTARFAGLELEKATRLKAELIKQFGKFARQVPATITLGLNGFNVNSRLTKQEEAKNKEIADGVFKTLYELASGNANYYEEHAKDNFDVSRLYYPELLFESGAAGLNKDYVTRDATKKKLAEYLKERKRVKDYNVADPRRKRIVITVGCSGSGKTTTLHYFLTDKELENLVMDKNPNSNDHGPTPIKIVINFKDTCLMEIDNNDRPGAPEQGFAWRLLAAFPNSIFLPNTGRSTCQLVNDIERKVKDWKSMTITMAARLMYYHKGVRQDAPLFIGVDELMELEGKIGIGEMFPHKWIDCQDKSGKWHEAQITEIKGESVHMHYKGGAPENEWIDLSQPQGYERVSALYTKTKENSREKMFEMNVGTQCRFTTQENKDTDAVIDEIDEQHGYVRVCFGEDKEKIKEWINKDSWRIQKRRIRVYHNNNNSNDNSNGDRSDSDNNNSNNMGGKPTKRDFVQQRGRSDSVADGNESYVTEVTYTKFEHTGNDPDVKNYGATGYYAIIEAISRFYDKYSNDFPVAVILISSLFNCKLENATTSGRPFCFVPQPLLAREKMWEFFMKDDDFAREYARICSENESKAHDYEAALKFLIDLTGGFPSQFGALYEYWFGNNYGDKNSRRSTVVKRMTFFASNCELACKDAKQEMEKDSSYRAERLTTVLAGYDLHSLVEVLGIPVKIPGRDDCIESIRLSTQKYLTMKKIFENGLAKAVGTCIVFPPLFLVQMEKESVAPSWSSERSPKRAKLSLGDDGLGSSNESSNDDSKENEKSDDKKYDGIMHVAYDHIFDILIKDNELSGKPWERRCMYFEVIKSRYWQRCELEFDCQDTVYGLKCKLYEYLGFDSIDAARASLRGAAENMPSNEVSRSLLDDTFFFPIIDKIDDVNESVDVDTLGIGVMYAPKKTNFPFIDYFSKVYCVSKDRWYIFCRQAKQAVYNLTNVSSKDSNDWTNKMGEITKKHGDAFCLLLSPKTPVKTWHCDAKTLERQIWMDRKSMNKFFGPQFNLLLRWTVASSSKGKESLESQETIVMTE